MLKKSVSLSCLHRWFFIFYFFVLAFKVVWSIMIVDLYNFCFAVVKPESVHAGATLEVPSEEILSKLK